MDYDAQKMQIDRGHGGIKAGIAPPATDPDSIENLVATLVKLLSDNKIAIRSLRTDYLGSWPEEENKLDNYGVAYKTDGLIGQLRSALYTCMDDAREIREHIVAISKGVR